MDYSWIKKGRKAILANRQKNPMQYGEDHLFKALEIVEVLHDENVAVLRLDYGLGCFNFNLLEPMRVLKEQDKYLNTVIKQATEQAVENIKAELNKEWDGTGLPLVGTECLVFNGELSNPSYESCTIDFIGFHIVVYSSASCKERTCNLELVKFKPIDKLTEEQKHLTWIYGRMIKKHNEASNVDYMLKFKSIIDGMGK